MTPEIQAQHAALEAEFAAYAEPLAALEKSYADLREQIRPHELKMAEIEAARDRLRHDPRYLELAARLPHLRKAVGA